ncbi:MAG: hypothetical protein QOJ50_1300, partial [Cryptosporangiaceae bacterium]|nr:hypothetical protein [Cryptosporangiaceae bacterium]
MRNHDYLGEPEPGTYEIRRGM